MASLPDRNEAGQRYGIELRGQAKAFWEKLADDGTEDQITAFETALEELARDPYKGNPLLAGGIERRGLLTRLYGKPVTDAGCYDGDNPLKPDIELEFGDGHVIELLQPKIALIPSPRSGDARALEFSMADTFIGAQIQDARVGSLGQIYLRTLNRGQKGMLVANNWNIVVPYLHLALGSEPK